MFRAIEAGQLEMSVEANASYLRQPLRDTAHLDVPGVPLAYRQTAEATSNVDSSHLTATVCVGDWRNFGTDTYANYPFVHAPLTPFVENACVAEYRRNGRCPRPPD